MTYRHTQRAMIWLAVIAPIEAVVLVVLIAAGADVAAIIAVAAAFALAVAIGAVFGRLTVEVDPAEVRLAFGNGWPRRQIPMAEIETARRVRNRWWYGFGIRKIPGGWMWNVFGLDAVELRRTDGKVFRIGTDDLDGLIAALGEHVPSS